VPYSFDDVWASRSAPSLTSQIASSVLLIG
jgi:hypothetical protein